MGFISAIKYSALFDKRIRAYGLEPRELPPELCATICSSFERRSERYADNSGLTGHRRSDFIEANIEGAADLLVLCVKGIRFYILHTERVGGLSATETVKDLARDWVRYGAEGTLELTLMQSVNQLGQLNLGFASAFKDERSRQQVRS